MALDTATRQRLEQLREAERKARADAEAARAEFVDALREARAQGATIREIAEVVGLSHQLVHYMTRHDSE